MADPAPEELAGPEQELVLEVLTRRETVPADPVERLRRAEAREQVRAVVAAYAYLADLRRFEELLDLYTDDAERTLAGTVRETVRGREALRAVFFGGAPDRRPEVTRRHHVDSVVVKLSDDGSRAWAVAMGTVVVLRAGQRRSHEDVYLFELTEEDGRYRIARQVVVTGHGRNPLLHAPAAAGGVPGASAVADAMDRLGLAPGVLDGVARVTGRSTVAGPARVATVRDTGEPGIPGLADFLDGARPGDVLVLGWGARARCSVFGDLAATRAVATGAAGLVVDGWCRDVDAVEAAGLSVHARGTTPLSGKGRLEVVRAPHGASVAGVAVRDGDWVVADRTGACVVPAGERHRVLSTAAELEGLDQRFRDAMARGAGFADAGRRSGTL